MSQSASGGSTCRVYLAAMVYKKIRYVAAVRGKISWRKVLPGGRVLWSHLVYSPVSAVYASKQGAAGVARGAADGSDWKHALSEIEAFSVFLHPRDPNLSSPAPWMASIEH
jgi:hypothetical protein